MASVKRQSIDNGSWFDIDKATQFTEETTGDCSNEISVNTGSEWEHEDLYRTEKGAWVLNAYSAWQGSGESWELIDGQTAVDWLIRNDHDIPDDLKQLEKTNEV